MAKKQTASKIVDDIPVKVPIPERIKAIADEEQKRQALNLWWLGENGESFHSRYKEHYRIDRRDEQYIYLVRKA